MDYPPMSKREGKGPELARPSMAASAVKCFFQSGLSSHSLISSLCVRMRGMVMLLMAMMMGRRGMQIP